jgi:prolyl oligopeptidase
MCSLYSQDTLDGKGDALVDPNTLSDDGTIALSLCDVSENGEFLAAGLSSSGSDWLNIKVMKVADKAWQPDSLLWVGVFLHILYNLSKRILLINLFRILI